MDEGFGGEMEFEYCTKETKDGQSRSSKRTLNV